MARCSMKRVLTYAKLQLEGGVPSGDVIGSTSIFVCQKCGCEYHLTEGLDPCAFCNSCKHELLDLFAETLVNRSKKSAS